ncbi:defender against death DAD protein [Cryphonectria parasitica EP155]|uniref:Dolichyl-diphosphooligosaccharide--protein glycosyltransferase subunit OST2 n=1 Tax=Cryphonectria parasitica (strain ATCC 38755 / EP155) TaxID=660469 RepID=A0A9P5CLQ9_CRYP1|nr:defender against death DAD protein [Cryphonectria parasitica EP155]KAF3762467.1 defender against death DAD protein [Cryphonectria parasitica EP155]
MAPKKNTSAPGSSAAPSKPQTPPFSLQSWPDADKVWNGYWKITNHQTRLLDIFLAFLVLVGGLQMLYFLAGGRNPYNAFLAGFIATVGQFALTVSLRMQTVEQNKESFSKTTPERAFADFIFGSLILHFFCINYIN